LKSLKKTKKAGKPKKLQKAEKYDLNKKLAEFLKQKHSLLQKPEEKSNSTGK